MTSRPQGDSSWRSVILYGAAALMIVGLLPGCSMFQTEAEKPKAELTQAEKSGGSEKTFVSYSPQNAYAKGATTKLLSNKADLELLIRSMQVKQQKVQFTGEKAGQTEEVTVDYLQVMTANQAALKNDLAALLAELDALTATAAN